MLPLEQAAKLLRKSPSHHSCPFPSLAAPRAHSPFPATSTGGLIVLKDNILDHSCPDKLERGPGAALYLVDREDNTVRATGSGRAYRPGGPFGRALNIDQTGHWTGL